MKCETNYFNAIACFVILTYANYTGDACETLQKKGSIKTGRPVNHIVGVPVNLQIQSFLTPAALYLLSVAYSSYAMREIV